MTSPNEPSILVVDDDTDICRNLTDILSDLGYRVDTAHDGPSALRLLERSHYDVALLDLKMPGMDGLELYREIKRRWAGTVALLVTAYATPATAAEALAAGAWKVVNKPVDFAGLMALVDEALGQPLVLVVDDDRDLCDSLWDLLRERGYRVGLAHGVEEAAEQIEGAGYRVVLIDLRMPDGGGEELFRRVRAAAPEARTILITGHRAELGGVVERVLSEGADAVCYKPFDVPSLLETLQSLTARG
ncbi:MAG TPA: response regulator [Isosphaeraceae bacterium]|jgi:DNA-binding NtrC family response regulator|nr:response regulator [Isosphaeraceae bacterium]